MSARPYTPYNHPRRPEGPILAGDRVRIVDDDGVARIHGTVLSRTAGDTLYVRWDTYDTPTPSLVRAGDVERFGRTPAGFLARP